MQWSRTLQELVGALTWRHLPAARRWLCQETKERRSADERKRNSRHVCSWTDSRNHVPFHGTMSHASFLQYTCEFCRQTVKSEGFQVKRQQARMHSQHSRKHIITCCGVSRLGRKRAHRARIMHRESASMERRKQMPF